MDFARHIFFKKSTRYNLIRAKESRERIITSIWEGSQIYLTAQEITNQRVKYYFRLYSKQTLNIEQIEEYFNIIQCAALKEQQKEALSKSITEEETIRKLKLNKFPESDVLYATYYKAFQVVLNKPLIMVMNEIQ